jgi:hypothetical protein
MKLTVQGPYAIGAVVAFFLSGALTNELTGNPNTGFLVACITAFVVWMIGRDKAQNYEAVLDDPAPKLFAVSDFEALAAIKEAMGNNIGDKWWTQKSFDDSPDEEGFCKAKYVMTYKEELKTQPPQILDRQLILDIKVQKVASQTSVKLHYQVASERFRWMANEILENTTALLWTRLDRLETVKGAKENNG